MVLINEKSDLCVKGDLFGSSLPGSESKSSMICLAEFYYWLLNRFILIPFRPFKIDGTAFYAYFALFSWNLDTYNLSFNLMPLIPVAFEIFVGNSDLRFLTAACVRWRLPAGFSQGGDVDFRNFGLLALFWFESAFKSFIFCLCSPLDRASCCWSSFLEDTDEFRTGELAFCFFGLSTFCFSADFYFLAFSISD